MAVAKNCWRKGGILHRHGVRGFVVLLLSVGEVSRPRGELAPLLRRTYNIKGGPLNVMKVVGRIRSLFERRVNSYKLGSFAMVFRSFCYFWPCTGGDDFREFSH